MKNSGQVETTRFKGQSEMEDRQGGNPEILIIRFSSLGDVLLATAAVSALQSTLPRSTITFLTKKMYSGLLQGHPAIARIVGYEKPEKGLDLAHLAGVCRGLGSFDAVVDLHRSLRSRFCSLLVPARRKTAYRKDSLKRRLWTMGWLRGEMATPGRHVVERYREALLPLGVKAGEGRPEVFLTPEEQGDAESFLKAQGVRRPEHTAVLVPGARWKNKRWTPAGFAEVGRWLQSERGMEVVLAGDAADGDSVRETKALLGEGAVDITSRRDLRELAAVLHRAAVVVGNDSGPGHLAAAVGTPVVVLFGPTSEAFGFVPLGEKAGTVSLDMPCRPCSLHGGSRCPRGRRACLDDLPPEKVITAVEGVLAQ